MGLRPAHADLELELRGFARRRGPHAACEHEDRQRPHVQSLACPEMGQALLWEADAHLGSVPRHPRTGFRRGALGGRVVEPARLAARPLDAEQAAGAVVVVAGRIGDERARLAERLRPRRRAAEMTRERLDRHDPARAAVTRTTRVRNNPARRHAERIADAAAGGPS